VTDPARDAPAGDAPARNAAGGGGPPTVSEPRERAAAALRRLGHALVGHECDPALLERIAVEADRIAADVEAMTRRSRPIALMKRQMWEIRPPDGGPMSHFPECVVSGAANPMGIAMQVRREGETAVADIRLGAAFEGAPERAHGGVVAAIHDDMMGYVLSLLMTPAYTGWMTVRYRAPVPIGVALTVRGRLVERSGRKLTMASVMHHGDALLSEAEALFIAVPPERFREG
jgi:acyl-coenzyme A thioesterase PaaI-like protein